MEERRVKCKKTGSILVITKPESIAKLDGGDHITLPDVMTDMQFKNRECTDDLVHGG